MHSGVDDRRVQDDMLGRLVAAGVQVPAHLVRGLHAGCLDLQRMCTCLRRETVTPEQEPSNVFMFDFAFDSKEYAGPGEGGHDGTA